MNTNTISKMLIAAAAIALTAAPRAWSAPDETPQAAPQALVAEIKTEVIQVKNMPPSWLIPLLVSKPRKPRDTAALPAGAVLGFTIRNGIKTDIKKGTPEGDRFEAAQKALGLPEGIESITPVEAQRALLVRGTAEGIARLRTVIGFLDLPLRRVEVEVQAVSLSKANLKELGVNFTNTNPLGPTSLGFMPRNSQEALRKLLDASRADVTLDLRATVVNNLPGSFRADGLGFGPTTEVQFTPTINNDDTITIVIQNDTKMPGDFAGGAKLQTVANVRDGDTVVLGGLTAGEQATVTFITARIVRRADENAAKK